MSNFLPPRPPECLTTGEACTPCPAGEATARACGYLAMGQEMLALKRDVNELTYDPKIAGTYTLAGVFNHIRHDEYTQEQLALGKCGLLFIDVRGLKQVNDSFGHFVGDKLLEESSNRIHTALAGRVRTRDEPVDLCRRQDEDQPHDLFIRLGGDEFGTLMYNIEPVDFGRRTFEIQQSLDVYQAVKSDIEDDGKLPIIASVAGVHMSELPQAMQGIDPKDPASYVSGFKDLVKAADKKHGKGAKLEQYSTMAAMLSVKGIDIPFETAHERKENLRNISAAFFSTFLPHFVDRAKEMGNAK